MSGILALLDRRGPPDPGLLDGMLAALRSFGADGEARGGDERAVVAVQWLRTRSRETAPPLATSADGSVTVAADARIDDRDALCAALGGAPRDAPDAELVLAAYLAWGEGCVDRLRGDFAFAVRDARRGTLFCARDHFGVRPLYWAALPDGGLVASSSLDVVAQHPDVPRRLDEQAAADFLIAGFPLDPDGTLFAGIRALPPASVLTAGPGGVRVRRYWTLEPPPELRYRRRGEYLEHFRERFTAAVGDRAAGDVTAVFFSGGRDSVAVAAALREARPGERVVGLTARYEWLTPDDDHHYARIAARALGVEHRVIPLDRHRVFAAWEDPAFRTAQPTPLAMLGYDRELHAHAAAEARVVLTGEGGDPALRESRSHLARLVRSGRWGRALREAVEYVAVHRRLPRPGLRTMLRDARGPEAPRLPAWLRPGAVRRHRLQERSTLLRPPPRTSRASIAAVLAAPLWPHHFAMHHPPVAGAALETAHPFLDLRLLEFLLAVPPLQWYNDKGILRLYLAERLPPAFLRRQKATFEEPLAARMRADGPGPWRPPLPLSPEVERWVDRAALPTWAGGEADAPLEEAWLHLLPLCLSVWLDRTRHALP